MSGEECTLLTLILATNINSSLTLLFPSPVIAVRLTLERLEWTTDMVNRDTIMGNVAAAKVLHSDKASMLQLD